MDKWNLAKYAFDPDFEYTGGKPEDTEYMVKEFDGGKTLFFSFHGANSGEDLKDVLFPEKVLYNGIMVSKKMLNRWNRIRDQVMSELTSRKPDEIIICSASMGAVLSTFFYIDIVWEGLVSPNNVKVLLFGAVKAMKEPIFKLDCVYTKKDLVRIWPLGWKQAFSIQWIKTPYPFWRFRKNHEYYGEFVRELNECKKR
jgi:hypothetical protein